MYKINKLLYNGNNLHQESNSELDCLMDYTDNSNQSNRRYREDRYDYSLDTYGPSSQHKKSSVNPYMMDSVSKAESCSKAKSRTYSCIKCLPRIHTIQTDYCFTIQQKSVIIFSALYMKLRRDDMMKIGAIKDEHLMYKYDNVIYIMNTDIVNDSLIRSVTEKITCHLRHTYELNRLILEDTFNFIIKSLSMKFKEISQRVAKTHTVILINCVDVLYYLFHGYIFYEPISIKYNTTFERKRLQYPIETSRIALHSSVFQTKTSVCKEFNLKSSTENYPKILNQGKLSKPLVLPMENLSDITDKSTSLKDRISKVSEYMVKFNLQPDERACLDILFEVSNFFTINFSCNEILHQQMERSQELEAKNSLVQKFISQRNLNFQNDIDDTAHIKRQSPCSSLHGIQELSSKEVFPVHQSVFDYSKYSRRTQKYNVFSHREMLRKQQRRLNPLDSVKALHAKISRLRQKSANCASGSYVPRSQRRNLRPVMNFQNNQSNLVLSRKAFISCDRNPYAKFHMKNLPERNSSNNSKYAEEKQLKSKTAAAPFNKTNHKELKGSYEHIYNR